MGDTNWNHQSACLIYVTIKCVNNLDMSGLVCEEIPHVLHVHALFLSRRRGSALGFSVYIVTQNDSQKHTALTGGVSMKLSSVVKGNKIY